MRVRVRVRVGVGVRVRVRVRIRAAARTEGGVDGEGELAEALQLHGRQHAPRG